MSGAAAIFFNGPAPSPPPVFTDVRVASTPDVILAAIQQQVATAAGLSLYRVNIVQDRDQAMNYPPNSTYVMIVPDELDVDQPAVVGGGRINTLTEWTIELVIAAINYLDPADRANQWLLSTVFSKGNAIVSSMMMFDPAVDGNLILAEPMRLTSGFSKCRSGRFGEMSLKFSVKFLWAMS